MRHIRSFTLFLLFLMSFVFVGSAVSHAGTDPYGPENKRLGVGIIAGEPTGLSLKGYLTQQLGIDAIASWSFVEDAFTLIGDLTYDFFDIPVGTSKVTLPFYAGAGVLVGFNAGKEDKTKVGVRVPIGVAVQWTTFPIEVFIEAAPGIELAPETEFDISGGVGVRFYFL